MRQLKEIINENTPISISLVVTLIAGIFWLTTLWAKTESTAQAMTRVEDSQQEYNKNLMEINQRLSRIEGRLKIGN